MKNEKNSRDNVESWKRRFRSIIKNMSELEMLSLEFAIEIGCLAIADDHNNSQDPETTEIVIKKWRILKEASEAWNELSDEVFVGVGEPVDENILAKN